MLINIVFDTKREHRRLFGAGVVYMVVMALLIALSIAIYQKVFTPVTMVTVHADRAGLQLSRFGDVRLHGVLRGAARGSGSSRRSKPSAVVRAVLAPLLLRAEVVASTRTERRRSLAPRS